MKTLTYRYPKAPKLEKDLIPKRLEFLSKVDHNVVLFIEALTQKEDMVRWSKTPSGELRPDTTPEVSRSLHEACWKMILACVP